MELYPQQASILVKYANLLKHVRGDYAAAERYYQRAIEANPRHADSLGNYAVLLHGVKKDFDGAETLYRRAVEADPDHTNNLGNYALFLAEVGVVPAAGSGPGLTQRRVGGRVRALRRCGTSQGRRRSCTSEPSKATPSTPTACITMRSFWTRSASSTTRHVPRGCCGCRR